MSEFEIKVEQFDGSYRWEDLSDYVPFAYEFQARPGEVIRLKEYGEQSTTATATDTASDVSTATNRNA